MLVHGMIDENVHLIHTTSLVNELLKACKPHKLQVLYPLAMLTLDASSILLIASHSKYIHIYIYPSLPPSVPPSLRLPLPPSLCLSLPPSAQSDVFLL